jgi:hypothetical protein
MAGCFGSSAIDRWMESNLNDYLDEQDCGSRTLEFKLFKGKKLINTYYETISNEDSCYYEMQETLEKIHSKNVQIYFNEVKPVYIGRKGLIVCDQETFYDYRVDNFMQEHIIKQWAKLPKITHIERKGFNMVKMGNYSIVCNDTLED